MVRSRYSSVIPAAVLPCTQRNIVISSAARNLSTAASPPLVTPLTRHTLTPCHFEQPTVISSAARNLFSPPTPHPWCHFERSEKSFPFYAPHKISPHFVRRNDRVWCVAAILASFLPQFYRVPNEILSFRAQREIFSPLLHLTPGVISSEARNLYLITCPERFFQNAAPPEL